MTSKPSIAILRTVLRAQIAAPQPPFRAQQQCRTLFLYHATHAITTLGSHGIRDWVPYEFPNTSDVRLNLLSNKSRSDLNQTSLRHALGTIAPAPGNPAYLCNILSSKGSSVSEIRKSKAAILEPGKPSKKEYAVQPLPIGQFEMPKRLPRSKGNYKRFFFTLESANASYFEASMAKMYRFLERKIPVEISITAKSWTALELMVKDNPQLHPATILAAMPPMSGIIIQPQTDGKGKINWVMLGPMKGKDGELRRPDSQTKKFNDFRQKVLDDLKESAEMGCRPDVVDPRVAAKSNIAVAQRLKRIGARAETTNQSGRMANEYGEKRASLPRAHDKVQWTPEKI